MPTINTVAVVVVDCKTAFLLPHFAFNIMLQPHAKRLFFQDETKEVYMISCYKIKSYSHVNSMSLSLPHIHPYEIVRKHAFFVFLVNSQMSNNQNI